MDDFINKFIEEATDLINELERSVLLLENNSEDRELINEVFRVMHSLKGGGAMFGFEKISNFTHNMENIYDEIRSGKSKVTKKLLDITLESVDHLRNLLDGKTAETPETIKKHKELSKNISDIVSDVEKQDVIEVADKEKDTKTKLYHIFFKPNSDIFDNGTNPLFLVSDLFDLGQCAIVSNTEDIPALNTFDHSLCYTYWVAFLQTSSSVNEIKDIFMFVEDECRLDVKEISNQHIEDFVAFNDFIKSLDKININKIKKHLQNLKPEEETQEKNVTEKIKKFAKESEITSIRIATEKIDQYMNLISELVTAQASLKLYTDQKKDPDLHTIAERIEQITDHLRENVLSITLIPIENTIIRFKRLVRDLSSDFNKKIDFVTEGTNTRIDKTLLQIITDPLMHIIRNSIDHGIENEEERIKSEKPVNGTILLKAYHSGSNVHIEISDDGRGLDRTKIKQKAIEKQLISPDTELSDDEVIRLIFLPGFSTTDKVSDVSGRGVGMDVLKRKVAEAHGNIEIDSKFGKGTKITIKIPLTLSIIEGLLVTLSKQQFIIPLVSIAKIRDLQYETIQKTNKNIVVIDGEQVPFYLLKEEFEIPGEYPKEIKFIMVKYENSKVGLVFDEIISEYQAVLKPLGKMYKKYEIASGATILGNGTVALILDTNKVIKKLSGE